MRCREVCVAGLDVLAEPGERIVPGDQRLLLVVARAGVIVEGVLGAGVHVDLEIGSGVSQRGFQFVPAFVREVARILGVDTEHGGLDVRDIFQRRGRSIEGNGCPQLGHERRGAPGDSAAEAEANHPDPGDIDALNGAVMCDRRLEVAGVAGGVDVREDGRDLVRRVGRRAALAADEIGRDGDVAGDGQAPGDIPDVIGQAPVLVADKNQGQLPAARDRRCFRRAGGRGGDDRCRVAGGEDLIGGDRGAIAVVGDLSRADRRVVFGNGTRAEGRRRSLPDELHRLVGVGGANPERRQHRGRGGDPAGDVEDARDHVATGHQAVIVIIDELVDEIVLELVQFAQE